ncbi:MAG: phosphotransferase family protein [Kouleothrix sp.]
MAEPQSNQRFECLARELVPQGRLVRAWPLSGGISATMTALEIGRPGAQPARAIVRCPGAAALACNPHAARDEYRLLGALHALGIAAPRPYLLDDAGTLLDTPSLVIEYIDGAIDFAPADRAGAGRQLAAHLAAIHRADTQAVQPLPAAPAELGARPGQHARALNVGRAWAALQAGWPPPQLNPPALLHGDFWPGNILWRGAAAVAVIDWEDAALGDPLRDLAVSRLDLLWIFGCAAMEAFTERYRALMPIDYTSLVRWDLYAALRLARLVGDDLPGWAAFFTPFGRPDITAASISEHYQRFVAQALAQLG